MSYLLKSHKSEKSLIDSCQTNVDDWPSFIEADYTDFGDVPERTKLERQKIEIFEESLIGKSIEEQERLWEDYYKEDDQLDFVMERGINDIGVHDSCMNTLLASIMVRAKLDKAQEILITKSAESPSEEERTSDSFFTCTDVLFDDRKVFDLPDELVAPLKRLIQGLSHQAYWLDANRQGNFTFRYEGEIYAMRYVFGDLANDMKISWQNELEERTTCDSVRHLQ